MCDQIQMVYFKNKKKYFRTKLRIFLWMDYIFRCNKRIDMYAINITSKIIGRENKKMKIIK